MPRKKNDEAKTAQAESLRILEYRAAYFLGLKRLNFKPSGRVVQFTGKNGAGKSSAVASLAYALGGRKYSPEVPQNRDQNRHEVTFVIGNETISLAISRTGPDSENLSVTVTPPGKRWGTNQAMLDDLINRLSFDPISFVRMEAKEQARELRKALILSEDVDQLDVQNKQDFEKRREIGRERDRIRAEAMSVAVQDDLPAEKINEVEISARIVEANNANRDLLQGVIARQKLAAAAQEAVDNEDRNNVFMDDTRAKIETMANDLAAREPAMERATAIRDRLDELKDEAGRLLNGTELGLAIETAYTRSIRYIQTTAEAQAAIRSQLEQMRLALAAAEGRMEALALATAETRAALEQVPEGALIDANALQAELENARLINREIVKRDRRAALDVQWKALEKEYDDYTQAIEEREGRKLDAIRTAKMPVEGLTMNGDQVLFEGLPLRQVNTAQQLRIGVMVALAGKSGVFVDGEELRLRLVQIENGETLDTESMASLVALAEEMDFYIWMARKDESGTVGIFLEDGEIKKINEPAGGAQ
jgi:hypothetical protein